MNENELYYSSLMQTLDVSRTSEAKTTGITCHHPDECTATQHSMGSRDTYYA